ncbi:MAG: PAS domain S-box protein [Gemmatimonadaceae bacterium]
MTSEVMAAVRQTPDDPRIRGLEATLRRRDAILGAVSHAATRFLTTTDWDTDIREVIGRLGSAAELSRVYLFEGSKDSEGRICVRMRHEWVAPGLMALGEHLGSRDVPLSSIGLARWEGLASGEVIHGTLSELPESERDYFRPMGIRSLAAMPVFAGETWWGYVAFTDDLSEREWSQSVLEALHTAAATLGAAIYRKRAEETLRESEARFRQLNEAAFEGVLIHDNGVLIEANPAIGRIFGYGREELKGKNFLDLVPIDESRKIILEHLRRGSEETYEVTGRRKDGTLITAEITGRNTTYQGRPVRVATVLDITERKKAEEELRRREAQLAEAQAIAHLGSWEWELQSNTLKGSDELYRIYGFEPDITLSPELILQRVHPDDAERVRDAIDAAVQKAASFSLEHRIVRAPGDVRIFQVEGRVVLDNEGKPARIIGAGQDITERVEAEGIARRLIEEQTARAAAETARTRAAFLAEASRVLGISFDYQTTLATLTRLVVPALADYCTLDLIGADGKIVRVAVAHVDPAKEQLLWDVTRWVRAGVPMVPHLRRALQEGESTLLSEIDEALLKATSIDEEYERIIRQIAPKSLVSVPLLVAGKITGVLCFYSSESDRHYGPDDLALAQELARRAALSVENARLFHEADKATRARDQMLGVVAHDLRNPLGTILMASELLGETLPADAPGQRQVAIVHRAGERMNRLIQDLLDLRRIDSGALLVECKFVPAHALLTEAAEMLRPLAAGSKLELRLEAAEDLPPVPADPNRVQQVLSNLIGNAIKFTPHGGSITVRGERTDGEVLVSISDTGPGIPPEQLPHIFGQFWQGARADARGIGLGLAIAKGIVEAHKGRIWVESVVGEGSSFFFTLPTSLRPHRQERTDEARAS